MSKVRKKIIGIGVDSTKKVLSKSPKTKNLIKRVLETQLGRTQSNPFKIWVEYNFPDYIDILSIKEKCQKLKHKPLLSIVLPTYNTKHKYLKDCIDSVRAQIYDNWELCIVDDASTDSSVRNTIKEYADKDNRIKYKFLASNLHISGASNEALTLASGLFICLLDHDDILWPNALYEVAKEINKHPKADIIYSDEDKINDNRHEHLGAFFKPDWNPDFLRSVNYITHLTTIRRTFINQLKGFNSVYDGAQDWDLLLRATIKSKEIYHIPKVIYSWRIHSKSTAKSTSAKPYVVNAQKKALIEDAKRRGYENAIIAQDKKHRGYWNVSYPVKDKPLISIIIPSKNQYKVIKRCIDSIYKKTTYKNFEIILVDTGSTESRVLSLYKRLQKKYFNFKLIDWPEQPFSYSRSCNKGAEEASGDILVMLNNDTEIITPNWLELMAGDAQRIEIGAVGCLLFYPDGYHIQHAGVGVGLGGAAANSFSKMTLSQPMSQTQHLMLNTKHDMTVVTAACLMIRKSVFDEVGGFSEKFRVTYNDVDLCLRLYEKGYQNLYTPYVRLKHHESLSIGSPKEIKKRDTKEFLSAKRLFKTTWKKYIVHDPNLNPNLSKDNAFYDV